MIYLTDEKGYRNVVIAEGKKKRNYLVKGEDKVIEGVTNLWEEGASRFEKRSGNRYLLPGGYS